MKNQQIFLLKLGVQLVTILVLVSFSFAGTNLSAKLQNKKKIVIQKTVKKQQARTCDAKQSPKKMPKKVTRPRKKTEPRVPKKPTNKKVVNQAKPPERKMTNQSNKNNKKVTSGKRKTNRKVDNKRKGSTPKINAQQKKRNPMINNRGGKNNPGIVIDEMKNDRKGVKQKKRNSHKSVNPDKRTSPKIDDRSSKPVRIIASGMNKNTKHGRKGRAKPVSRNIKKEVPSKASEKEFRIDQHYSSKPNKPGRNEVVDSLYRKNKSEDKTGVNP